MIAEDGSELHPTGYHTKTTSVDMKAKFQFYLTYIVQKMTGLYPKPKAFVPFGGSSAPKMASFAPVPSAASDSKMQRFTDSLGNFWSIGVGVDEYSINKYRICTQDWHWPLRKRITKKLKKERLHKESIIKNLEMITAHMQYKQPSEFSERDGEESGISESSRLYKINYESGRISTRHLDMNTQN